MVKQDGSIKDATLLYYRKTDPAVEQCITQISCKENLN